MLRRVTRAAAFFPTLSAASYQKGNTQYSDNSGKCNASAFVQIFPRRSQHHDRPPPPPNTMPLSSAATVRTVMAALQRTQAAHSAWRSAIADREYWNRTLPVVANDVAWAQLRFLVWSMRYWNFRTGSLTRRDVQQFAASAFQLLGDSATEPRDAVDQVLRETQLPRPCSKLTYAAVVAADKDCNAARERLWRVSHSLNAAEDDVTMTQLELRDAEQDLSLEVRQLLQSRSSASAMQSSSSSIAASTGGATAAAGSNSAPPSTSSSSPLSLDSADVNRLNTLIAQVCPGANVGHYSWKGSSKNGDVYSIYLLS